MRTWIFGVVFTLLSVFATLASAQQTAWIQVEAQRSLARAQQVARNYAADLQSVNGFAMQSGWYAIALGPFAPTEAADIMRQLKITRQIPGDSYIVDGSSYRRQYWPVGASTLTAPAVTTETTPTPETPPATPVIPSTETLVQARASERALTREERELIQTALQWEGFYSSAIDGAFGPGTRKAMAAWQESQSRESTGVLTTVQRQDLVGGYQDMLATLGLAPVTDTSTGIAIDLPTAMVEFDRYEPPFAHFKAKGDSGVKILLISQTGDEATLRGLYDIMQTLEVVPLDGPREIGARNFTLTGQNSQIASYTYAALANGHVKGFTVIWPAQPDKRRAMVINAMKASFTPLPDTVLPDVYGDPNPAQSLDLLAGLTIRKPDLSRSGFFVDTSGRVLTTAQAVQSCERITLDDAYQARVQAVDAQTGLALLQPINPLAPIGFARLSTQTPRLNSEIAVAGYSFGGVLGAPTLTYGTLSDLRGLAGEPTLKRLDLEVTESDSGGPVFDARGAVLGMLLPEDTKANRKLPKGVSFATGANAIEGFLSRNAVEPAAWADGGTIAPEDLTLMASDMTVLVSCWN